MTTLYWHFLDRHEDSLMKNPRTVADGAQHRAGLDMLKSANPSAERAAYVLANLDDL
jgi:deoxyribodipyrimidine photolyase-like uncharacterized protein